MKFDSKVVIPTQFVLFNLSAIIGSAVLYGDFRRATLHQMVTFLYGCGATFAGVFMLTWTPGSDHSASKGKGPERRNSTVENVRGDGTVHGELLLPSTSSPRARAAPILRTRSSRLSLVGLSPAQRVLLVRPSSPDNAEDLDDDNDDDEEI